MRKYLSENEKLIRELFILNNINVCCSSTIKEKELTVKDFTKQFPKFTFYEVCRAIKLSKGAYYNFLYNKKGENLICSKK